MSANTALVTDASKAAAQKTLDDYAAGVAAHIGGDWAGHNQARVYNQRFLEPISGHQVSNYSLRLMLALAGVDQPVIVPAIATDVPPAAGSAPLIVSQPVSLVLYVGATATFSVTVASAEAVTYQWRKNGVNLSGKTASSLVIPGVQFTDQASYTVVVSNVNGSVTSSAATLTVLPLPVSSGGGTVEEEEGSGGCFKAGTLITLANDTQIPIEKIIIGTAIKSLWIAGIDPASETSYRTWSTSSLKTKPASTTVVAVLSNAFHYYYVINGSLEVTVEHPLLVMRKQTWQWVIAGDVQVGDTLYRNQMPIVVRSKIRTDRAVETWNIDVEPYDVFFANGYLVHNATGIHNLSDKF